MMTMGLNSNGTYIRPDINEIRSDYEDEARAEIADDASVSDAHLLGQLLGIMSYGDDKIEKAIEAIYWSRYQSKSHGDTLDYSTYEDGIYRKLAAPASIELQIDADVGTTILAGALFSTDDGIVFITEYDVSFTEVAQVDDPDNPGNLIPLTDTDGNELARQTVSAKAEEAGPTGNVGIGAVTYNVDSNDEISAVTNLEPATGGTNEEDDTTFYERAKQDRESGNASTPNGLEAAIESVSGVVQARAIGNNTMETDKYGNPPKSTHLYVIGGADEDIATMYFNSYAITTYTVGEVTVDLQNDSGDTRTIKFSRAVAVPIYVSVSLTTNDDFDTDNGVNAVKANLISYFTNFRMGQKVIYSKLFSLIWSVPGIDDLTLTIGTDKAKLANANVSVDEFKLATLSADDIEVTTNA